MPNTGVGRPSGWQSAAPSSPLDSGDVNQFLQPHGATPVYQGEPLLPDLFGAMEGWEPIAGAIVDQPFVMPAGQTTLGWVRIPITTQALGGLGIDSAQAFEKGVDLTVSLYTDSGGSLGTLLASTLVPHEAIEALASDLWNEPQPVIMGGPLTSAGANVEALTAGSYAFSICTAGSWAMLIGGQTGTVGSPTYSQRCIFAPFTGADIGSWINGPQLPYEANGLGVCYLDSGYVVIAGGFTTFLGGAYFDNVNVASFSNGTMGAWQEQASAPLPLELFRPLLVPVNVGGTDYVYCVGGVNSSDVATSNIYVSAVSGGQVQGWSSAGSVGGTLGGAAACTDGVRLYVSDDNDTVWSAPILAGGALGSFTSVGSLGFPILMGVVGSNLIRWLSANAGNSASLALSPDTALAATADLARITQPGGSGTPGPVASGGGSWIFPVGADSYLAFVPSSQTTSGYSQVIYPATWVKALLPVSGLTAGATYHLVLTGAAGSLSQGESVGLVSGSTAAAKISTNGGTSWTTLPGNVRATLFNGNGGQLLGLWEDNGARTSYLWYDQPSNALLTSYQCAGPTRSVQVLQFDPVSQQVVKVIEVA
jgi:hypothetical protein